MWKLDVAGLYYFAINVIMRDFGVDHAFLDLSYERLREVVMDVGKVLVDGGHRMHEDACGEMFFFVLLAMLSYIWALVDNFLLDQLSFA